MARLLVDDKDVRFVLFELLKVQELCDHERCLQHSDQIVAE